MGIAAKDSSFWSTFSLKCRGRIHRFDRPVVMGILNTTPDSFYEGSRVPGVNEAIDRAGLMIEMGATMLDLGGASTRPGAPSIPVGLEAERVLPIITALRKAFPEVILSIDTWRSEIALGGIRAGADMINDISAGTFDREMFRKVAELDVPIVIMHTPDKPAVMQKNPTYDDIVNEVMQHLSRQTLLLRSMGVSDIIIDPGFGFGKTLEHNYSLLANLDKFRFFDLPIMVGVSRKSMICKPLDCEPSHALNGTTAAHAIALQKGANILRVHDVKEAIQTIAIVGECMKASKSMNLS